MSKKVKEVQVEVVGNPTVEEAKKVLFVKHGDDKVEVTIEDTKLVFQHNGQEVSIDRGIGVSDYRKVYSFLNKKTSATRQVGKYTVGNFNYMIVESAVHVFRKDGSLVGKIEDKALDFENNFHQRLRTLVTNWLINTLE